MKSYLLPDIPDDLHRQAKILAAQKNTTIKDLLLSGLRYMVRADLDIVHKVEVAEDYLKCRNDSVDICDGDLLGFYNRLDNGEFGNLELLDDGWKRVEIFAEVSITGAKKLFAWKI